jgi:prophage regulatory protein
MPLGMLDRLILDPGTRTLGELLQEREWAVGEIRRLRNDLGRLSRKREALRIERELEHGERFDPALNAQRLLRLAEVSTMVGLRRSAIYKHISEGRFPAPVKVGDRSVRWKLADVLAWRAHISESGSLADKKESGTSAAQRPKATVK